VVLFQDSLDAVKPLIHASKPLIDTSKPFCKFLLQRGKTRISRRLVPGERRLVRREA
jgi:hypothetical protein